MLSWKADAGARPADPSSKAKFTDPKRSPSGNNFLSAAAQPLDFRVKPGACVTPIPAGSWLGYSEDGRGFDESETHEIALFHQFCLTGVVPGEGIERFVNVEQLGVVFPRGG